MRSKTRIEKLERKAGGPVEIQVWFEDFDGKTVRNTSTGEVLTREEFEAQAGNDDCTIVVCYREVGE